ncbi:MAG TPA: phosphatase [Opitutaceae bacterium]|nr:phosphatase [Opitutaceae bacterium]
MSRPVAVIDIGSNSIKVLVAARDPLGNLRALVNKTLDARIGTGISADQPKLSEEGMTRGLGAIRELLMDIEQYRPAKVALVATSAVRDAANGADFCRKVKAATKHDVRVLSGKEEANAIGRGLTADRALADLEDFYVFDLGGGSLECLSFVDRQVRQAASLQLGCVRLMEKFAPDPGAPFTTETRAAVSAHVLQEIAQGGFRFDIPAAGGVGVGGTVTTIRAILGAKSGKKAEQMPAVVTTAQVEELLGLLGPLPLDQRKRVPGLPPPRADVFPVALATILAVAEAAGLEEFRHSFYNLRWGVAAEMV